MNSILVFIAWAPSFNLPPVQNLTPAHTSVTHPVFVDASRDSNGLTLYNERGEVVARCEKKEGIFRDRKMEPGVNLDAMMNAWVHAYLEVQK